MQHAGGVLLAAGLDGGNTMIESSPVTIPQDAFASSFFAADWLVRLESIQMQHAGGVLQNAKNV